LCLLHQHGRFTRKFKNIFENATTGHMQSYVLKYILAII
jgi:hypothetical protein